MKTTKIAKSFIENEMQNLEEIGGPDSIQEYIECLTEIRNEFNRRIEAAKKDFLKDISEGL